MEARFSTQVQSGSGAHPASYTMGTGSFQSLKRPGRGVKHPPHLAPKLKKEKFYTSNPTLGVLGLLQGELYLYLYIHIIYSCVQMCLTQLLVINTTFLLCRFTVIVCSNCGANTLQTEAIYIYIYIYIYTHT